MSEQEADKTEGLRFCIDCRWHEAQPRIAFADAGLCRNANIKRGGVINLVTGQRADLAPFCSIQREASLVFGHAIVRDNRCGPEGAWWEPARLTREQQNAGLANIRFPDPEVRQE